MSSTVWCWSTSRSPFALSVRSKRPCTAKSSSMWSRNGSPVSTLARPEPSSLNRTCTSVSLVWRTRRAPRAAGITAPPWSRARFHRGAVITHAFVRGDGGAGSCELSKIAAHGHAAGPAHEVVDAKGGRPACRATGREGVVRSRDVVAERDGRAHPDEDGAGMAHVGGQRGRATAGEQHVLGRGLVRGLRRGEQG